MSNDDAKIKTTQEELQDVAGGRTPPQNLQDPQQSSQVQTPQPGNDPSIQGAGGVDATGIAGGRTAPQSLQDPQQSGQAQTPQPGNDPSIQNVDGIDQLSAGTHAGPDVSSTGPGSGVNRPDAPISHQTPGPNVGLHEGDAIDPLSISAGRTAPQSLQDPQQSGDVTG
ncbi:MAG: hypothetical protein ACYSVY_26950, partial [Planctomycetota bacterium]